ncbi:hypothetical protein CFOL_v3_22471 [Cephalotus follicularis]|uniref:Uncharacterized protein n=1 Tax=Cephalotus follicularis TaxID=3775 RepID=A0A1Q3CFG6_CEPFO|nr:hypothetical protein CFOL_v3_22471 [Cephalotus follicularis]
MEIVQECYGLGLRRVGRPIYQKPYPYWIDKNYELPRRKTSMTPFFVVDSSSTNNALLGRDWIHTNWCIPSSLYQCLILWNGGHDEMVQADKRPFVESSNAMEAWYYDDNIELIK